MSQNIVFGEIINNFEKLLSDVGRNIEGIRWIEPDNLTSPRPVPVGVSAGACLGVVLQFEVVPTAVSAVGASWYRGVAALYTASLKERRLSLSIIPLGILLEWLFATKKCNMSCQLLMMLMNFFLIEI